MVAHTGDMSVRATYVISEYKPLPAVILDKIAILIYIALRYRE